MKWNNFYNVQYFLLGNNLMNKTSGWDGGLLHWPDESTIPEWCALRGRTPVSALRWDTAPFWSSPCSTQLGLPWRWGPLQLVRHNHRNLGSKVKWVFNVTRRILGVLFSGATSSPIRTCGWRQDWWVSEVNRVTLDFWGTMASCLPSAHLIRVENSWFVPASASTMLGADASKVKWSS